MIRIRELREAQGLQQKDLAIDLGVTQPTISGWESGIKVPSARNTQKIADYFNVSTDYLLGRDDEKKEPPTQSGELSPMKREAWEAIQKMDDETLRKFVQAAKVMLGD